MQQGHRQREEGRGRRRLRRLRQALQPVGGAADSDGAAVIVIAFLFCLRLCFEYVKNVGMPKFCRICVVFGRILAEYVFKKLLKDTPGADLGAAAGNPITPTPIFQPAHPQAAQCQAPGGRTAGDALRINVTHVHPPSSPF